MAEKHEEVKKETEDETQPSDQISPAGVGKPEETRRVLEETQTFVVLEADQN